MYELWDSRVDNSANPKYPKAKCIAFNNTGTDLERIKMIASESFVSPTSIDEFTCLFDKE